jgi:hypothetical protein
MTPKKIQNLGMVLEQEPGVMHQLGLWLIGVGNYGKRMRKNRARLRHDEIVFPQGRMAAPWRGEDFV